MASRRIGVVGLGMAAAPHALSLLDLADRVQVAGCHSPTPTRRAAFAERFGLPVTDDLDALLRDPTVSAMLVLTPPDTHAELVARCADAGKHVLLEKPLDATPLGARAVVETMDRARLTLGVVFQHRFRPAAERLAGLVREGALGRPLSASVAVRWWRDDAYFAEPGRGMKARDGGGVLLTQAIHTLDLFVSLLGLPREVAGFAASSGLRAIDTEDVAVAALRYDGGPLAVVDATTTAYPGFAERVEMAGTLGTAILSGDRLDAHLKSGETIRVGGEGQTLGGGADPMAFRHVHHRAVIEDFLDALDEGRRPRVDGHEALKVHRLIEAMLQGGVVQV